MGNQLTELDLSNNTNLLIISCGANMIENLDFSNNTALLGLDCWNNNLHSLNLKNGNNQQLNMSCADNPYLTCISVDDHFFSTTNWTNIDPQHYFSNDCSTTKIQEHSTNKELLKATDLLGRETKQTNQPLLYLYDNGTVEKRIIID